MTHPQKFVQLKTALLELEKVTECMKKRPKKLQDSRDRAIASLTKAINALIVVHMMEATAEIARSFSPNS